MLCMKALSRRQVQTCSYVVLHTVATHCVGYRRKYPDLQLMTDADVPTANYWTNKLCAKNLHTLRDLIVPELRILDTNATLASSDHCCDMGKPGTFSFAGFRTEYHEVHLGVGTLTCECCAMELYPAAIEYLAAKAHKSDKLPKRPAPLGSVSHFCPTCAAFWKEDRQSVHPSCYNHLQLRRFANNK